MHDLQKLFPTVHMCCLRSLELDVALHTSRTTALSPGSNGMTNDRHSASARVRQLPATAPRQLMPELIRATRQKWGV